MQKQRINQIDNLKGLLILLVILGHILECVTFKNSKYIYTLIYVFHMPAFCFISGYCSNPNNSARKIFVKYLYPYIVFQTIYLIYNHFVLGYKFKIQYTTPYWTLWYLLSLFIWNLMLMCVKGINPKVVHVISIIISIVCGYDTEIGKYLSLSRILGFFPYFILGYMMKQSKVRVFNNNKTPKNSKRVFAQFISLALCIVISVVIYNYKNNINYEWLYLSQAYVKVKDSALHRIVIEFVAVVFISMLCLFSPKSRIPLITHIGENTMSIYLLHAAIISTLHYYGFFENLKYPITITICLAILIVVVLSLKPFTSFVNWINTIPIKLSKRKKRKSVNIE